jgi:hypothetical protein
VLRFTRRTASSRLFNLGGASAPTSSSLCASVRTRSFSVDGVRTSRGWNSGPNADSHDRRPAVFSIALPLAHYHSPPAEAQATVLHPGHWCACVSTRSRGDLLCTVQLVDPDALRGLRLGLSLADHGGHGHGLQVSRSRIGKTFSATSPADHHSLFGRRSFEPNRGCGKGLWRRVPQESRIGRAKHKTAGASRSNRLISAKEFGAPGRI